MAKPHPRDAVRNLYKVTNARFLLVRRLPVRPGHSWGRWFREKTRRP